MTVHFEFRGKKYPIDITYYQSIKILPEKFGINLSKIFTDGEVAADTMQTLILDDEKTLDLCWHYLNEKTEIEFDEFLEVISGKDLERFREDFWAAVVNFFKSPEEETTSGSMESIQEGSKESRLNDGDIRCVALNLQARGVEIDDLTLGEIIYMENKAHERDQINWACSAQNSELLPKKTTTKQSKERAAKAIKARVSPVFEKYYATYGNPRKKT